MKALYMTDSYLSRFNATVKKTDGKQIMLDETAFYPQGGGQPSDTGFVESGGNNFKVVAVFKKDGEIWHELDREGLAPGDNVACTIDWERRYRLMRMHTAAHIIDAVFFKETGALITGNQLGSDKSRIDFALEVLDREKMQPYIDKVNEIIRQNIDVHIYFLKREEALKIDGIVKLASVMPPEIDELRIVEIPGVDLQADGGTQVKNTKEIGRVLLLGLENKGKNNRRMYFTIE
jgi:Ser-tRNA(Ala) deacylase AlaX